jgi:four helix bundle protein
MGIALKELRETRNCLRMILLKRYIEDPRDVEKLINENQQLISIFGSSINTAKKRIR